MNLQPYAVFLDIDGTLMAHGQIPQKNIDAIAAARSRGHKVYINTGRSYACIPKYLLDAIEFDGIVAGVGSYIRYRDQVVHSLTIPQPLLSETADYFVSKQYACAFEGEEKMIYLNLQASKDFQNAYYMDKKNHFKSTYRDVRITKATVFGTLSDADHAYLKDSFVIYQHDHYAEIALKGCSKSVGMQRVLDDLSIGRQYSLAMGDSTNDLDMLTAAGISVAMGNATDEIKAVSNYITADVAAAGVAEALEKFLP